MSSRESRARLRADLQWKPDAITKDEALKALRRYVDLYPAVAPEVTAVHLLRQIDSWEEFRAILSALDQTLKEAES